MDLARFAIVTAAPQGKIRSLGNFAVVDGSTQQTLDPAQAERRSLRVRGPFPDDAEIQVS
jgi:hypothetical protein